MKYLMVEWWNIWSSVFRKQNQRKARFSESAAHSRRNELRWYSEEPSSALMSTAGWIAGLPSSRQ